ncbi:hypothetical protein C7974DRAFT_404495 [Boeremia exigua]|uniref:uncharacterized protein n=1 Tax=Boeremia exigua TaxID=749465 RepID=UPI001E8D8802|nr:uncharacterized protein C7974DRAFT_404495 [Boeremia exigua]KAH6614093.1 hypothetical protein C7974DRAFT_404495 [Boeremia exigua]
MKADSGSSTKAHFQVSFASPTGSPGAVLMRIDEEEKKTIVFRMPNGQEAMRITKQVHLWSGKSPEYHGYAPDGRKLWHLSLKSGLLKTTYDLTLEPSGPVTSSVEVKKTATSGDLGLLVNNCLAVTISKPNIFKWRRENVVNVAPGMDILLALGLNWIRYDKQDMDAKAIGKAAGDVGSADGGA